MNWKDNKNDKSRYYGAGNKYMFLKIGKQVYNDTGREFTKLTTSKILKEYLDEQQLGFFKFGVDKKGNKTKLFILFSNEEDTFYGLRNAEGGHKTTVSINQIVDDLKVDGINLPLERLKIEDVPEADKEKLGVDKEAHLFEVILPTQEKA